ELVTMATQVFLGNAQQFGQTRIGEALALEAIHQVAVDSCQTEGLDLLFVLDQVFDLHQEPRIDHVHGEDFFDRHASTECIRDVPDTLGARHGQFALEHAHAFRVAQVQLRVQTAHADFKAAQGFLQGFLESPADGHDFANRLHLGSQACIGFRELLEGEARQLGNHVVDGRLEGRRSLAAGDFVLQFVEGVTDGQLGCDASDRETCRFRSQGRGTRYTRVHLDHNHAASVRADAELDVGAAGFNADLTQYRQRGVTHDLVFLVGQRLGWRNSDGVAGVDAHRIEVFDGADDDAVVLFVADHFHLV